MKNTCHMYRDVEISGRKRCQKKSTNVERESELTFHKMYPSGRQ
jgi:hypothetical protein